MLTLTLGGVIYLRNSGFGLALQAVREDAVSAAMAGVNVVKMRVIAWLASALVAGLAGGIYAWYVSVFYPDNVFSGEFSIFAIVFALFGGVATIVGPIVGVIILYGVYNLIGFTTPQYFQLIYGLLIMGLVLFLPAGLVSLATRPRLLLLDELAAGLNPAELDWIAGKIKALAGSGTAIIVVEHLMGFVEQITDRVIVLNAGKEIFEGKLAAAVKEPQVIEVFLGGEHAA